MSDLLPPHNLEAEEAVLGSLMIDPASIPLIASFLKPEDFYIVKNGWIYSALLKLGEKADLLTVSANLQADLLLDSVGGDAFLAQLTASVPTALNVEAYAEIVLQFSTRRKLISAASEIARMGYDGKISAGDAQEKSVSLLNQITVQTMKAGGVDFYDSFQDYCDWVQSPNTVKPHETGVKSVDAFLDGGLYGEYMVLAAMPGAGKTAMAVQMAFLAARKGKRVLFASLEEPRNAVISRMVSFSLATKKKFIPFSAVLRKKLSDEDMQIWIEEVELVSRVFGRNMIIIEQRVTPMELKAMAIVQASKSPLDLILVDQLNHMNAGAKFESEKERITSISGALCKLPQELSRFNGGKYPGVVGVTRLSRQGYGKPSLEDLKETGSLEYDAQVVLLMSKEQDPKQICIDVAKQRNGRVGEAHDVSFMRECNVIWEK